MNSAFNRFMTGLVDYAGLFPPAKLDMAPAVADYARYRQVNESWMLGRFICPAARLGEMADCLEEHLTGGPVWELSVLIGGGTDPAAALNSLASQTKAIAEIEDRFKGQVKVAALESPIPLQAVPELGEWLADFSSHLVDGGLGGRDCYLEVPAAGQAEDDIRALQEISRLRHLLAEKNGVLGAKFRCGGVTPEAFPSVRRLAGIIDQSRRLDLPLKFTAGLHHPVRHQALEPEVMMHGFLNVFGASLMAYGLDADVYQLVGCLGETDPAAFLFSEDSFRWNDQVVASEDIARIRDEYLGGFGSCSFTEPCQDLQEIGLLKSTDDLKG